LRHLYSAKSNECRSGICTYGTLSRVVASFPSVNRRTRPQAQKKKRTCRRYWTLDTVVEALKKNLVFLSIRSFFSWTTPAEPKKKKNAPGKYLRITPLEINVQRACQHLNSLFRGGFPSCFVSGLDTSRSSRETRIRSPGQWRIILTGPVGEEGCVGGRNQDGSRSSALP